MCIRDRSKGVEGYTVEECDKPDVGTTITLHIKEMCIRDSPQGINNVITYALIGDTVEYLEWKTGERAEGICFSMQTFINK